MERYSATEYEAHTSFGHTAPQRVHVLQVGDTVQRTLGGPTDFSHVGVVTHIYPKRGTIGVEWPWGNDEEDSRTLLRSHFPRQTFNKPTGYDSYDRRQSERVLGFNAESTLDSWVNSNLDGAGPDGPDVLVIGSSARRQKIVAGRVLARAAKNVGS